MSQSTTPQHSLAGFSFFYHFELTKQAGFAHSFTKLFSLHKMNLLTGQNLEKLSIKHIKINQIRVLEMRFLEHITAMCSTEKNSVAANIFPPSQENIFNWSSHSPEQFIALFLLTLNRLKGCCSWCHLIASCLPARFYGPQPEARSSLESCCWQPEQAI